MIQITEEHFKDLIEEAHRAGQHNQAGCDPSAYEAMVYYEKVVKNNAVLQHVVKSVCEHDYEQVYCESYYECRKCGNMSKIG